MRVRGKGAAKSVYNSLPRNFKTMPLVDALMHMGSASHDLLDVVFDVAISPDRELFAGEDLDNDHAAIRSYASRDDATAAPRANAEDSSKLLPGFQTPRRDRTTSMRSNLSRDGSPQRRLGVERGGNGLPVTTEAIGEPPLVMTAASDVPKMSPLARLFTRSISSATEVPPTPVVAVGEDTLAGIRRMEHLLEGIRDLPVHKLKEEMRELQVCFVLFAIRYNSLSSSGTSIED